MECVNWGRVWVGEYIGCYGSRNFDFVGLVLCGKGVVEVLYCRDEWCLGKRCIGEDFVVYEDCDNVCGGVVGVDILGNLSFCCGGVCVNLFDLVIRNGDYCFEVVVC